jgi:hypothetical protein
MVGNQNGKVNYTPSEIYLLFGVAGIVVLASIPATKPYVGWIVGLIILGIILRNWPTMIAQFRAI